MSWREEYFDAIDARPLVIMAIILFASVMFYTAMFVGALFLVKLMFF